DMPVREWRFEPPIRVANLSGRVHAHPWRPRGADDSGDAAVTVETILRQKGADVATIEPEASIRRAADWLRVKNIGALVVTSGKTVLGLISEREIVHAFSRHGETVAVYACEGNHAIRRDHRVPGRECQSRDAADDAPSRAPHACAPRRQARRYHQHR